MQACNTPYTSNSTSLLDPQIIMSLSCSIALLLRSCKIPFPTMYRPFSNVNIGNTPLHIQIRKDELNKCARILHSESAANVVLSGFCYGRLMLLTVNTQTDITNILNIQSLFLTISTLSILIFYLKLSCQQYSNSFFNTKLLNPQLNHYLSQKFTVTQSLSIGMISGIAFSLIYD